MSDETKVLPTPGRAAGRVETRKPRSTWAFANDRDKGEVVRLWTLGHSCIEIACRVNRSIGWVYDVLATPEAQEIGIQINKELDQYTAESREQLARASQGAVERLVKATEQDENLSWAVRAADSILDRSGIPRATRVQGAFIHANVPASVAEALRAEAKTVNESASPDDRTTDDAERD